MRSLSVPSSSKSYVTMMFLHLGNSVSSLMLPILGEHPDFLMFHFGCFP